MWNCALIFECVVGHCVYFLQKFLETLSTSRLYILIYKTLYIQAGPFYSVFASHYRPWMFTSWQHCNIRLKMGHKNRDNLKIQNYNKKGAKQCFENTLYVDGKNGQDTNDGLTEATALKTLKGTKEHLNSGTQILVMDGTYR